MSREVADDSQDGDDDVDGGSQRLATARSVPIQSRLWQTCIEKERLGLRLPVQVRES